MITAAMLSLIVEAGEGVLVLVDGLLCEEFSRSRLTRAEVLRQLGLMAGTLHSLPPLARQAMPEIDWAGWQALAPAITAPQPGPAEDDAAWFAATALVPATLSWLRVYRQGRPDLFTFR